eukprot:CAMPEP_0168745472 /NCGR_PEP_ID=MMETSP0724-20121128/14634_1 /TAXON_ID=265536 /ORGANISM="Amphiprora sp., Strain CCMP467" /LENGTH=193 /DNA_ID=CAMNT_0008793183 /DNA_START=10 /DNA_END=592 /DNA_ORIENTATION=-
MIQTFLSNPVVSSLVKRLPQALSASTIAAAPTADSSAKSPQSSCNDALTAKDYHPDFSLADRQIEQTVLLIENNMLDIQKNYHPVTKEHFLKTSLGWMGDTSFAATATTATTVSPPSKSTTALPAIETSIYLKIPSTTGLPILVQFDLHILEQDPRLRFFGSRPQPPNELQMRIYEILQPATRGGGSRLFFIE